MDLSLVMFTAEGDRRDFRITKSRTVIGRQNNCDLRIPLASVSRQHCEIITDHGSATLRDLGSSNGTYHNHNRVQSVHLSAGDQIVIGPVVFTVVKDGHPDEVTPVRTVLTAADEHRQKNERDGSEDSAVASALNDKGASRPQPKPDPEAAEAADAEAKKRGSE
jgi:pSer/pThr/pTyr-binding forkhead associated (FHA) protein